MTNTLSSQQHRSACPVACTLDILGDRWSLLVIRDLLMGLSTYSQLQSTEESIPSNILAARLKRLQEKNIIKKELYQERPKRYKYCLTDKGWALAPVMAELAKWGLDHVAETSVSDEVAKAIKSTART